MDAYFAFTDECGSYQKIRSENFIKTHPYYVRATVIMSFEDYLALQVGMDEIKSHFGLQPNVEVKWSHFGNALKNNYSKVPHTLTVDELREYYRKVLLLLCDLKSATVYYTLTENKSVQAIDDVKLIKMHFQNAMQRIQSIMFERSGFALVVADDLNDKTKALKQAIYELTLAGDYVQYTNIKKGVYIDFSNQCHGLQIADICAGVFTATAKYCSSPDSERHKFKDGYDLFISCGCMKTRSVNRIFPYYEVYRYGVKEVPGNAGKDIAKKVSTIIEKIFEQDLMRTLHDDFDE